MDQKDKEWWDVSARLDKPLTEGGWMGAHMDRLLKFTTKIQSILTTYYSNDCC